MDTQQDNHADFLFRVVQILEDSGPKSIDSYALGSFLDTATTYHIQSVDEDSLKLWIAAMYMKGMKTATVSRYVGKLHSVYTAFRQPADTIDDPFLSIRQYLDSSYEIYDEAVRYNVEIIHRLFSKDEASDEWTAIAMFFYLLYNADASLLDLADATFSNAPQYCSQVVEIIKSRDSSKGRKYLFNLGQRQVRQPQIFRNATYTLTALLTATGMKSLQGPVREEITALWVHIALQCGIDISLIRAIITAVPYEYKALSLIRKPAISEPRLHEVICTVADAIYDNTPRWFVMKLRKGVELARAKEKIDETLPGRLKTMEFFYPTRTTFREKGGKMIKQESPLVPDLLFFKTRYNKLRSLFAKIGDIAWCMKDSAAPDARYSVISQEEMSNFQKCVGQFTDDIRISLADASRGLGKGRMVRITGGMMKGYEGKIEDIHDHKGTRMFFLQITNDQALRWTAQVDEAFISPL